MTNDQKSFLEIKWAIEDLLTYIHAHIQYAQFDGMLLSPLGLI